MAVSAGVLQPNYPEGAPLYDCGRTEDGDANTRQNGGQDGGLRRMRSQDDGQILGNPRFELEDEDPIFEDRGTIRFEDGDSIRFEDDISVFDDDISMLEDDGVGREIDLRPFRRQGTGAGLTSSEVHPVLQLLKMLGDQVGCYGN